MARHDGAVRVSIESKLLLTPAEAAGLASVGYKQALYYIRLGEQRGGWRSLRVGAKFLVPRAFLEQWANDPARQAAGY